MYGLHNIFITMITESVQLLSSWSSSSSLMTSVIVVWPGCFFCVVNQASDSDRMMMTISEIIKQLIAAHEQKKDINLNKWVELTSVMIPVHWITTPLACRLLPMCYIVFITLRLKHSFTTARGLLMWFSCRLKGEVARQYGLASQPKLVDIIAAVPQTFKNVLVPKLKAKPIRTASGIAVVAVMCKPHRCPHINFTGNICVWVIVLC